MRPERDMVTDEGDITQLTSNYLNLFTLDGVECLEEALSFINAWVTLVMNEMLSKPFTTEEI